MKRELAFALESFSQLASSLGRTRSSKPRTEADFGDVAGAGESTGKRRRGTPKIKSKQNDETEEKIDWNVEKKNGIFEATGKERPKSNGPKSNGVVCEAEPMVEKAMIDEAEVPEQSSQSGLIKQTEGILKKCSHQDSKASDDGKNQTLSIVKATGSTEVSALTPKKLEMKMSKKIELAKLPTTVKELLATGLLEGYPVFYNGGTEGSTFRGSIKDAGIMCLCSSCMGSKVFSPCQFEIHVCSSYKRATQYICFENGTSLLDVVKACRDSCLDSLDETILRVVGPLPVKESIPSLCKGSSVATNAERVEQDCRLGVSTTDSNDRSLQPVSALRRSGRNASGNISYQDISGDNSAEDSVPKSASASRRSSRKGLVDISSPEGVQGKKRKERSSKLELPSEFSGSISELIMDENKSQDITQLSSKATLRSRTPKSSSVATESLSSQQKSNSKITRKDLRLHRLVFEEGGLPDRTEVAYYSDGKKLLKGYIKDSGICCSCCDSVVSASTFEAHAGRPARRKPYNYIYTSNGVSLHEYAVSLLKNRSCSAKDNDDLCTICADGGDLLLCDGCPRAFHKECASLSSVPQGKWFCQYCQNMFVRERFVENNANALAAGRIAGVDLIEQIEKRCIRIVETPDEVEVIACILCSGFDFLKTGFGPRTVIVCDQCEKEYHIGCLKEHNMADLKEVPKGKWFCCNNCTSIFSDLQSLINRGEEEIHDSLLEVIKRKNKDKVSDTVPHFEVKWRVLNGKIAAPENRQLLAKIVSIFHESFDPIVDSATGRDFIPSMVYGRNIKSQDFSGMYCAILTVNSTIVSAGLFRVFGQGVAELPLVATSNCHQGKGYFQLLFSSIQKLLSCLKVKTLVLPAAPEAESIWTDKFGFEKIDPEILDEYKKNCWQMLTFHGTRMLQKTVPSLSVFEQESIAAELKEEW